MAAQEFLMIRFARLRVLCFSRRVALAAFVFILSSAAPAAIDALAATPQADSTAEAKQHYQNAVAAIAKSDWVAAKAELLQAEKLAPQNALVHYDLALAYSHTGSPKSALTELNKALQLGLPAAQKQDAEQLRLKLASQGAASNSHKQPKTNADSKTESSLNYFVGSWVAAQSKDTNPHCRVHEDTNWRLVIRPGGSNQLLVKLTSVYKTNIGNVKDCNVASTGKTFNLLTVQYEGSIFKQGEDFRMSVDDGTCTGDCQEANLTGAAYTLQINSQDEFVRIHKVDDDRVVFKRE
jgi:hypothetical protein